MPDGVFCTRCGAHQGVIEAVGDPKLRERSYAAHPGEAVVHASVFTTLFPHLGQHKVHEFRWAFLGGLAAILILYLAGLITAAILVSAFLVPVLYLIYLYEAQVYRDEPALVLGFTIGGGFLLGLVLTVITNALVNPVTASAGLAADLGTLFLAALLVPVLQEVVKPLPALVLRGREPYGETVDGLVFGIAAGLGFSVAETLIRFSAVLTSLPMRVDNGGNWVYPLMSIAVFQPLMQASATGIVVAAIWRHARGRFAKREWGGILLAVLAHIAFSAGSTALAELGAAPLVPVIWQAIVVGGLLIYVRYLLHHSLLEEAAHLGYSETICPSCHRHIYASGFCPNCGMALTAAPMHVKRARRPRAHPPPETA
ncbi:MAG TPA: PrsW family glutamic-type intramembrane protease [Candidatus Dormibacteraeota bacterium]